MNRFGKMICARILASVVSATTAFAAIPAYTIVAASPTAENADKPVANLIAENDALVDAAEEAVGKVKRTGSPEDLKKANSLALSLSPTNSVRLYVRLSRSYYTKNFKNKGFTFFDADKYLLNNPDVMTEAILDNAKDPSAFALEHYLTYGVFEARSSETEFDPVAAILARPEILGMVDLTDSKLPEAVFAAYRKLASKGSTAGILVDSSAPADSDGFADAPLSYTLYVVIDDFDDEPSSEQNAGDKDNAKADEPDKDSSAPDNGGGSGSDKKREDIPTPGKDDKKKEDIPAPGRDNKKKEDIPAPGKDDKKKDDVPAPGKDDKKKEDIPAPGKDDKKKEDIPAPGKDDKKKEDIPTPGRDDKKSETRQPQFINKKTTALVPYDLIKGSTSNHSFTTNQYADRKNGNQNVTVTFFADNYAKAKQLSKDKSYTFMIYMCGTDEEKSESYRRVSLQIVSMLQANIDNVNVLLFVGGTNSYGNSLMNEDAVDGSTIGASGLRTGIYYLNPSALSDDVKEKIRSLDLDADNLSKIMAGGVEGETEKSKGLRFNDIINSQTLIQLSSTTAVDMSDPALLSGFINFSTDLFPADNYGLSLSNHGGGILGGIISSDSLMSQDGKTELIASQMISINDLEAALSATNLYKDKSLSKDGRLGFIFYDACLMGTAEQAYNTKDYYRYMVASEEITRGNTDYGRLLNTLNTDVASGASDREIAINLSKGFGVIDTHKGIKNGEVGSIAVFSSDDMEQMYTRINALSKDLSSVLTAGEYSDAFKNDVFVSLRKASLASYPMSADSKYLSSRLYEVSAVDIGDFYNLFKKYLDGLNTDGYTDADRKMLSDINEKLGSVLDSGFLAYLSINNYEGFGEITKTDYNKAIPLNYSVDTEGNVWRDITAGTSGRSLPYGSSIFMPIGYYVEDMDKEGFNGYYKDSALSDYTQFVNDYLAYLNNASGYKGKMTALAKELSENYIYGKLITQPDGNRESYSVLTDSNGKEIRYISFKVADSYSEAGLAAPEHSTGSPMLDILETQTTMQLSAVHREYFKVKGEDKEGVLMVDMICAEDEIKPHSYSLDGNTVVFDITDQTKSIITGFAINGKTYDKTDGGKIGDYDWQFVLKSSLEYNTEDKKKAVSALYSPEETVPEADNFITVMGGALQSDGNGGFLETGYTYHAFLKNDNDKYDYCGSISYNEDNTFTKMDTPLAISVYHYVLGEEKDENGNVIRTYKVQLEGNDGFKDGYYATPDKATDTSLYIDSCYVTENIGTAQKPEHTQMGTAYVIDVGHTGKDYSQMAYPNSPDTYDGGGNVGNGNLEVINPDNTKEEFINSIGVIIYDNTDKYDQDTVQPVPFEYEEDYIHSDGSAEPGDVVVEVAPPAEEALPAEEIKPVEESGPVEEEPVQEAQPAEEIKPAEEPQPAEEVEQAQENQPAEESSPTEEASPAQEAQYAEEVEPIEEAQPNE